MIPAAVIRPVQLVLDLSYREDMEDFDALLVYLNHMSLRKSGKELQINHVEVYRRVQRAASRLRAAHEKTSFATRVTRHAE